MMHEVQLLLTISCSIFELYQDNTLNRHVRRLFDDHSSCKIASILKMCYIYYTPKRMFHGSFFNNNVIEVH